MPWVAQPWILALHSVLMTPIGYVVIVGVAMSACW